MAHSLYRGSVFALYQFSVLLGIMLLPVALAAQQLGVTLPIHRVIDRLDAAYEDATETPA